MKHVIQHKGHIITVDSPLTKMTLIIDGEVQDNYDGLLIPKELILTGTIKYGAEKGDIVTVIIKRGLLYGTLEFNYNGIRVETLKQYY
ncbi:hypothetical protein PAESOLCIP111_01933 [Paenibacillus solanacearum]|uniref:Uncharacterized protein n=1 Tax=Paenibacillus solanacearum TaxID=2048548 RepID=A0A916NWG4_9BACL|nr:hypothetical protein [Paenibacillus solanacearum]CAG7616691.1 hypothetical protein PAESOLCIP111_01933 [Paenibacillus solanacearum]